MICVDSFKFGCHTNRKYISYNQLCVEEIDSSAIQTNFKKSNSISAPMTTKIAKIATTRKRSKRYVKQIKKKLLAAHMN